MVCNMLLHTIMLFIMLFLEFLISSSPVLSSTTAGLWRRGQAKSRWSSLCLLGGATPHMINGLAQSWRSWDVFYTWRVSFTCFRNSHSCNGLCWMLIPTTGLVSHLTRRSAKRNEALDVLNSSVTTHIAVKTHHTAPEPRIKWKLFGARTHEEPKETNNTAPHVVHHVLRVCSDRQLS